MGLFDWPGPAFGALDGFMAAIFGPFGRVVIWALLCASLSMLLYRVLSPQGRIRAVKSRLADARLAMAQDDGTDFKHGMSLAKAQLAQSLKLVAVVAGPAIAASLPALALIVWLDGQYGYRCPAPGQQVAIFAEPADAAIEQVGINPDAVNNADDGACPIVQIPGQSDGQTFVISPAAAVPVIHQKAWWNALIGNPAGYLPDDSPVRQLRFDLPSQQIITIGPDWARGWELTFFAVLLLGSLAIKKGFRIE